MLVSLDPDDKLKMGNDCCFVFWIEKAFIYVMIDITY
jgi:hypothetical protein